MIFYDLIHQHFDAIISISNQVLGKHYLNPKLLNEYINNPNKKALVVKVENKIVGFINSELIERTKLPKDIIKEVQDLSSPHVYFIKQVIVHPSYQKKGLGKKMIHEIINQKHQKNIPFLCLAWKKDNHIPIEKTLFFNGFQRINELPNYWYNDSLLHQYNCLSCGTPPCKCGAVLFFKIQKSRLI